MLWFWKSCIHIVLEKYLMNDIVPLNMMMFVVESICTENNKDAECSQVCQAEMSKSSLQLLLGSSQMKSQVIWLELDLKTLRNNSRWLLYKIKL